jgi:hypothetical protein
VKARLRRISRGLPAGEDRELLGWVLQVWCPGCYAAKGWGGLHQVGVVVNGEKAYGQQWEWDGVLEPLTVSPSLLVTAPPTPRVCHSFIRDGRWEYLTDSTHPLAGQTVDMVDLPDWLVSEP